MEVVNNPEDPSAGSRSLPFTPRAVDRARRLHGGAAGEVLPPCPRAARCGCGPPTSSPVARSSRTPPGEIVELRCTYDPATRGGSAPDGRRPKATLHWVCAPTRRARPRCACTTTSSADPDPGADGRDLFGDLNPDVRDRAPGCLVGAQPRRGDDGRDGAVRAPGLLHAGPRFDARPPRSSTGRSPSGTRGPGSRRRGGTTRHSPGRSDVLCNPPASAPRSEGVAADPW